MVVPPAADAARGGCLAWCTEFTCAEPDCNGCGRDHGCQRTVVPGSVKACATFCNRFTCDDDACKQCNHADAGCEGRDVMPPSPPPHPSWPPLPRLSFGAWKPAEYYTYGASIYTNAWGEDEQPARLRIKGAAWFGLESSACHIGGSDQRGLASTAAWLREQGFNAIRVPFAADAVISPRHKCMNNGNLGGIREHNPKLLGMTYRQRIAELVTVAGNAGLVVLLDAHVISAGVWPDGGKVSPEGRQMLTSAWQALAEDLCDPELYWNIMGGDLKNEPYGMYWGSPPAMLANTKEGYSEDDRWDTLASEVGSMLYRACPRWLSFVQGVGHCMSGEPGSACRLPSAPGIQDLDIATWWGENLQAAEHSAVDVGERRRGLGKVVASPHTYGPSTYAQPQFNTSAWPNYPDNLPKLWSTQWGYLATQGVMPVVVGEFGGRCVGADEAFQTRLVQFLTSQSIGAFYWSLNPESGDTGGLITDWTTTHPEAAKLKVLEGLRATRVPTTAERIGAKSLFSVSALPPPAPSPILSPSPRPPAPAPPRDTTFDFLFDDVPEEVPGGAITQKAPVSTHVAPATPTWVPSTAGQSLVAPSSPAVALETTRPAPKSVHAPVHAGLIHDSPVERVSTTRASSANQPTIPKVQRVVDDTRHQSFGVPTPTHVDQIASNVLWLSLALAGLFISLAIFLSRRRNGVRRQRVPTVDVDLDFGNLEEDDEGGLTFHATEEERVTRI